ncbi:MAG: hypothetical protein AB8G11_18355 [Saprospiraceae bacterium]
MIFCLVAGMLSGFLRSFDFMGDTVPILFPGFLFGLALPLSNWKLYKNPKSTLIGFLIVSTAVYPMMVILPLKILGQEFGINLAAKIPYLLGIVPSILGAGILYLVYRMFLGNKDKQVWKFYFLIAIILGITFFPLMNFADNFVLSLGIWQGGIGFCLTQLHFTNTKGKAKKGK